MTGLLFSQLRRKNKGLLSPSAWDAQAALDSAPVGSVGAPSGVQLNTLAPRKRDPLGNALGLASMIPGAGDVIGPAADIRNFLVNPESRTLTNAGLFALGALPAIPSLAYLMSQGGDAASAAARMGRLTGQGGAIGYHGSPHKFDKFDMSKIGTGEGAQAYGHGLYFAENPEVAKEYMKVSPSVIPPTRRAFQGRELDAGTWEYKAASLVDEMGLQKARKMVQGWINGAQAGEDIDGYRKTLETLNAAGGKSDFAKLKNQSNLYHVDIPDEHIGKMLDWDGPLSDQPQAIQDMAKMWGMKGNGGDVFGRDVLKEAQRRFGGPKGAAEVLRREGIPGVRYLDAGSRGPLTAGANETRNFVLFDDNIPKILKRE